MDLGELNIPFIYKGSDLVYPSPIKDGLVLWYDFSGMDNSFENRDIATDLSGNGNHGTLQNFAYSEGSGYDKRGLLFDGVDDIISESQVPIPPIYTYESTFNTGSYKNNVGGVIGNYRRGSSKSGGNISTYGYNDANSIRVYYAGQDNNEYTMSHYYPKNTIVHVLFVIDDTSEKLYINGLKTNENSRGFISNTQTSLGYELGIWSDFTSYIFDGSIYSARIYNRPFTDEEIQHNYEIEKERFGIGGSEL